MPFSTFQLQDTTKTRSLALITRPIFCIVAIVLVTIAALVSPTETRAQAPALHVTITRPSEGETLYSSPSGPFAAVPVAGYVSSYGVPLNGLQATLDIIQGAKSFGSLKSTLSEDGKFSFDVGVNHNGLDDNMNQEKGCLSSCHSGHPPALPPGPTLLRVTVSDPQGRKATAERPVVVDQSGYANVPVQVVTADNPNQPIAGVTVSAAAYLYMWRARSYSGKTDANGSTTILLEALAQEPTHYIFQVSPVVVNGHLYQTKEPVRVDIPAGTKQGQPVTLLVESRRGQINGTVVNPPGSTDPTGLTVRAIELSRGAAHTATIAQGKFTFSDLPLDRYLLTMESPAGQSIRVMPQTADLTSSSVATATLTLATTSTRTVRGIIRDEKGAPLPLAWITTDDHSQSDRVSPTSAAFALPGVGSASHALMVTAPGYWSRLVAIGLGDLDISLTPQPRTRVVKWGTGTVTLTSQTLGNLVGNRYMLQRGWVWGTGSGEFVISTRDADVTLSGGSFALEYMPGEIGWLYVLKGSAQMAPGGAGQPLVVNAGQMVAFGQQAPQPSPVSIDDATIWALYEGRPVPVSAPLDSSLLAQVRDGIEGLGIPSTLAIFAPVAIVLVAAVLVWRRRHRKHSAEPSA